MKSGSSLLANSMRSSGNLGPRQRISTVTITSTSFRACDPPRCTRKWRKMAKLNRRRRWRGPALGGRLQRGLRFCFSAHDGEATTPTLTEWARPEIVYAGRWPTATQMVNQARALRSIGAKKVRRAGNGWVWRLSDNEGE